MSSTSEFVNLIPSKPDGLMKKIVSAGSGSEKPVQGSRVRVHYVGSFDEEGTRVFDSSRAKNREFVFQLGGGVILGWNLGVATMTRGERCKLRCGPEFAYGKAGAGGVIPPNATLYFDIELLGWE
jgi:FKBP-type peptidyl-prolyl cis-trans isomerase